MRIGIDLRCLQGGEKTGVGEYTIAVIKKILKDNNRDEFIFFLNSYKKGARENFGWIEKFSNAKIKKFNFPNKILNLSFWFLSWPKVDKMIGEVDVFFMPNISFIGLSRDCYKILTVHDLSFELFPENFCFKKRLWHFLINPHRLCQQSDKILTVSDSTKQDLISIYDVDQKKVRKIYPPFDDSKFSQEISEKRKREVKDKHNLPDNFVLYLGTIEPRKNIISLIKAFDRFKKKASFLKRGKNKKDLKLVIAGGKGWLWEETFKQAKKSKFRDEIIFIGFVSEKDKPAVYKLAKIFIFVSFFEGFGFPPLEAMASGRPVIASNCSSMPEILGKAAILVNPYRPKEITEAMEQLLEDDEFYDFYSQKGMERAKEISNLERKFKIIPNKAKNENWN